MKAPRNPAWRRFRPCVKRLIEPFSGPRMAPLECLSFAAWLGIVAGFLELGVDLFVLRGLGALTYHSLRINRHFFWMQPLSSAILIAIAGGVIALLTVRASRTRLAGLGAWVLLFLPAFAMARKLPGLYQSAIVCIAIAATCMIFPWVRDNHGRVRKLVRWTLPAAALALLVLVIGGYWIESSRERRTLAGLPAAASGSPNVLLVVLDTVRADALTPYGSRRDTTPNLEKWARRGVRFDNAHSTAPWTLPAHASLFTGRWVHEHAANVAEPLDRSYPTLAEALSQRGYATAGFVANLENCNAWYGLDRGFAHYEDFYENARVDLVELLRASSLGEYVLTSKPGQALIRRVSTPGKYFYRKTAAMVNQDALAWLAEHTDRPFFMFLNYFDAHSPYAPPEGEERAFSQAESEAARSKMERARDCYDDCLSYLDHQLNRLLEELERRSVLDNTIVVITSDHGEAFGEHGLYGHGVSLYRPELHIPLIVVHPPTTPQGLVIDQPVSLRDVAATVLGLLEPGRGSELPGRPLGDDWADQPAGESSQAHPVLSEVDRASRIPPGAEHAPAARGLMRSLIVADWIYIRNGDDAEELYNLDADPGQRRNLIAEAHARDELAQLREQLDALTAAGGDALDN